MFPSLINQIKVNTFHNTLLPNTIVWVLLNVTYIPLHFMLINLIKAQMTSLSEKMTSQGGGWHIRGDAETVQTGLREINQTRREQAKADRDVKLEEKKTALAIKKAETAAQKAKIKADKEERVKNREAQKAETLKKLDNEAQASEQEHNLANTKVVEESEIAKKTIETETQKAMKGLEIQELTIDKDYELNTLKVTKLADLHIKSMDMGMTKMKMDHELAMEDIKIKRQVMTENLGALKKIEFKSRGASQYLSHMRSETSRTGTALMSSGRDQLAIGNEPRLALKGPGNQKRCDDGDSTHCKPYSGIQSSSSSLTIAESGENSNINPGKAKDEKN